MFTQSELDELFDIIAGTGKFKRLGPGLRSYPDSDDWGQIRIHEGCLELEKQGRIQRKIDGENCILWQVTERKSESNAASIQNSANE